MVFDNVTETFDVYIVPEHKLKDNHLMNFITSLQTLSGNCEFGELTSSLIRDTIAVEF